MEPNTAEVSIRTRPLQESAPKKVRISHRRQGAEKPKDNKKGRSIIRKLGYGAGYGLSALALAEAGYTVASINTNPHSADTTSEQTPHVQTITNPRESAPPIYYQSFDKEDPFEVISNNLTLEERDLEQSKVERQKESMKKVPIYQKMPTEILPKYADLIIQTAKENDIPAAILTGLFVLEGGGEGDVSETGALGFGQFMEAAAREQGLIDENGNDLRLVPEANIKATGRYLAEQKMRFGDNIGIALSANNMGPGNMFYVLEKFYSSNHDGIDLGSPIAPKNATLNQEEEAARNRKVYVAYAKDKGVAEILGNEAVREFFKENDFREEANYYPEGVVAGWELTQELNPKFAAQILAAASR